MLDRDVPRRGTVLAFDFGEKRIGVAVGEWELCQAHPLTTIVGEANRERFAAIAALIDEWRPSSLVVGLPLATDGSTHAMSARCTRFANQLRGRFALPVEQVDERYSSVEAEERLRETETDVRGAAGHAQQRVGPRTHLARQCEQRQVGRGGLRAGGALPASRGSDGLAWHVVVPPSGAQCGGQFGHRSKQVGLEPVVGDAEDRRLGILVDRDDHL